MILRGSWEKKHMPLQLGQMSHKTKLCHIYMAHGLYSPGATLLNKYAGGFLSFLNSCLLSMLSTQKLMDLNSVFVIYQELGFSSFYAKTSSYQKSGSL